MGRRIRAPESFSEGKDGSIAPAVREEHVSVNEITKEREVEKEDNYCCQAKQGKRGTIEYHGERNEYIDRIRLFIFKGKPNSSRLGFELIKES